MRCPRVATIDLKVNTVDHAVRTIAVAHSEVLNADGKQVAPATGSAGILPGRAASLGDLKLD